MHFFLLYILKNEWRTIKESTRCSESPKRNWCGSEIYQFSWNIYFSSVSSFLLSKSRLSEVPFCPCMFVTKTPFIDRQRLHRSDLWWQMMLQIAEDKPFSKQWLDVLGPIQEWSGVYTIAFIQRLHTTRNCKAMKSLDIFTGTCTINIPKSIATPKAVSYKKAAGLTRLQKIFRPLT